MLFTDRSEVTNAPKFIYIFESDRSPKYVKIHQHNNNSIYLRHYSKSLWMFSTIVDYVWCCIGMQYNSPTSLFEQHCYFKQNILEQLGSTRHKQYIGTYFMCTQVDYKCARKKYRRKIQNNIYRRKISPTTVVT